MTCTQKSSQFCCEMCVDVQAVVHNAQCGQRSWLPGLTWRSWTSCRGLRIYFMIDFNMVDPNPSLMSHMKLCFNSPFLFPFECPRGGCWLHDGGAAVAETGGSCMAAVHRTVSFISGPISSGLFHLHFVWETLIYLFQVEPEWSGKTGSTLHIASTSGWSEINTLKRITNVLN